MSRSAGAGSPVWFRCTEDRRGFADLSGKAHTVKLTGRERPSRRQRGSAMGSRSTKVDREYQCSCGHTGWSNHVDLERLARAAT